MVIRSLAKAFLVSESAKDALPPLFLAPALAIPVASFIRPGCSFSLSSVRSKGQRRRGAIQKQRGVSAIRRTGPRVPLSVHKYELPRPVLDPEARKDFKFNPDHGLWGFFNKARTAISAPEEEIAHGKPSSPHLCGCIQQLMIVDGRPSLDVSRAELQVLRGSTCSVLGVHQRAQSHKHCRV